MSFEIDKAVFEHEQFQMRLNEIFSNNTIKNELKNNFIVKRDSLYSELFSYRDDIKSVKFVNSSLSKFYKSERDKNLKGIAKYTGDTMELMLGKPYEVKLSVEHIAQYDNLLIEVNGVEPFLLSDGECQVLSLVLTFQCVDDFVVLDEVMNCMDSSTQQAMVEFMKKLNKQILIVEHDLDSIKNDYIVGEGTIFVEE